MLYSPNGFSRDQLLQDLLAAKARIAGKWAKGAFTSKDFSGTGKDPHACIVATAEIVTEQEIGFLRLPAENLTPSQLRLGRMIYALYVALAGKDAQTSIPISEAQRYIARFNDHPSVGHDAIMLLFDRAIQTILEPACAEQLEDEMVEA